MLYFGLKSIILLPTLHLLDTKWFDIKSVLGNCTGLDGNGNFVGRIPAAELLLNGEPNCHALRLATQNYTAATAPKSSLFCSESGGKRLALGVNNDWIARELEELSHSRKLAKLFGGP